MTRAAPRRQQHPTPAPDVVATDQAPSLAVGDCDPCFIRVPSRYAGDAPFSHPGLRRDSGCIYPTDAQGDAHSLVSIVTSAGACCRHPRREAESPVFIIVALCVLVRARSRGSPTANGTFLICTCRDSRFVLESSVRPTHARPPLRGRFPLRPVPARRLLSPPHPATHTHKLGTICSRRESRGRHSLGAPWAMRKLAHSGRGEGAPEGLPGKPVLTTRSFWHPLGFCTPPGFGPVPQGPPPGCLWGVGPRLTHPPRKGTRANSLLPRPRRAQ